MDIRKFFGKKNSDDATPSSGRVNESSAFEKKNQKRKRNTNVVNVDQEEQSHSEQENSHDENEDQNAQPNPAKRPKKDPIRKYDESYLSYGFICVGAADLPLPQCLLCSVVFKNSAMKPAPLKNHLIAVHKNEQNASLDYFKIKKAEWLKECSEMKEFSHTEMKAIKSSFAVAYQIAKQKKPFTIGERLLKPVMAEVAKIMFGETAATKIDSIPLSDNTISRRIVDMSQDVQKQLCSQLKNADFFCLKFDESTDVAGQAILTGFVRYPHEHQIIENIFCCCAIPERTTGEQIFFVIDNKLKEMELEWISVVGVCTDGASAMTGPKSGLAKRISDVANPDFESNHCVLHRESLASKSLSDGLNTTLTSAVKMINYIKMRPLQGRIFAKICMESDSEHYSLLLHTEVRWLSRGRALQRFHELRSELIQHFEEYMAPILEKREKKSSEGQNIVMLPEEIFLENLRDDKWMANLAYLVDIFNSLNELNAQLQGPDVNCFKLHDKIDGFRRKMNLWKEDVRKKKFHAFPSTKDFLRLNKNLVVHIQPIILEHIDRLISGFDEYFPRKSDPRENFLWVVNPFLNFKEKNSLSIIERNQLVGMSAYLRLFNVEQILY